MKKCIIQLRKVPKHILAATAGDIDKGMFISACAVSTLLKGEMFSCLECYWSHAGAVSYDDAEHACRNLVKFGIYASIIYIE